VGLPYEGTLQLLKLGDGSMVTGQTKNRRVYLSTLRVQDSAGFKIGREEGKLSPVWFSRPNDALGHGPDLFTGDKEEVFDAGWGKEDEIIIRKDDPLPLYILAICLRSEVEEK
jgi:hypothetical protein